MKGKPDYLTHSCTDGGKNMVRERSRAVQDRGEKNKKQPKVVIKQNRHNEKKRRKQNIVVAV